MAHATWYRVCACAANQRLVCLHHLNNNLTTIYAVLYYRYEAGHYAMIDLGCHWTTKAIGSWIREIFPSTHHPYLMYFRLATLNLWTPVTVCSTSSKIYLPSAIYIRVQLRAYEPPLGGRRRFSTQVMLFLECRNNLLHMQRVHFAYSSTTL